MYNIFWKHVSCTCHMSLTSAFIYFQAEFPFPKLLLLRQTSDNPSVCLNITQPCIILVCAFCIIVPFEKALGDILPLHNHYKRFTALATDLLHIMMHRIGTRDLKMTKSKEICFLFMYLNACGGGDN